MCRDGGSALGFSSFKEKKEHEISYPLTEALTLSCVGISAL